MHKKKIIHIIREFMLVLQMFIKKFQTKEITMGIEAQNEILSITFCKYMKGSGSADVLED